MKKIFPREFYLKRLRPFYQSDLIKVITGIRRCGKSSLILSIMDELKQSGVPEKDILYINLDKKGFHNVTTGEQLEAIIDAQCCDRAFKYLFVDEVQNVKNFEITINAYREEGNFSIFITGSNSYLLSGELATKLTGRYLEFDMFTLSFAEYCAMKASRTETIDATATSFTQYLQEGGFPQTLEFATQEDRHLYIQNVLEQVLQKDIWKRFKIRNRASFDKVLTFIINNLGATINLRKIATYLHNTEGLTIRPETLSKYIRYIQDARVIYPCQRFDLKSKSSLQDNGKFYLADTGIYFAFAPDHRINYGPILENILYLYLRSKGYKLSVGRIGTLECDFIARKNGNYFYIQVAKTIENRETEEREYRVLESIRDNYPKYLFTLDTLLQRRNGILHRNLIEFIAHNEDL